MHDTAPLQRAPLNALYLAPEVYACRTQGHAVFLDLQRDTYSAAPLDPAAASGALSDALQGQAEALIAAGLLSKAPGRSLDEELPPPAPRHILGCHDDRVFGMTGELALGLRASTGEIASFFAASQAASRALKQSHIAQVVEDVRRRKPAPGGASLVDVARLTKIFARLRPWYPRKYLCLYDSLALMEFLIRRGIVAQWVFAVQAQPFGAHCWVEWNGALLNEGSEYAGRFTPIMSV